MSWMMVLDMHRKLLEIWCRAFFDLSNMECGVYLLICLVEVFGVADRVLAQGMFLLRDECSTPLLTSSLRFGSCLLPSNARRRWFPKHIDLVHVCILALFSVDRVLSLHSKSRE
jgi:hypothetical protein